MLATEPATPAERLHCPHCGYERRLRPEDDAYRLYRAHAAHCRRAQSERQLCLPLRPAAVGPSPAAWEP
jgi:hypothetical protein